MKNLRNFLLGTLLFISTLANAEIAEVYSYKSNPGDGARMIENMVEAASIQRELGAHVTINALDVGSQQQIDYVVRFDSTEAWGSIRDKLQASDKWNDFQARIAENPSGNLELSFAAINIDQTTTSSSFSNSGVYGVWVWEVANGKLPDRSKDMTWTPWHQPGQATTANFTASIRNLIKRAGLRGEA